MSSIMIRDLAHSKELDGKAMSAVRGGALGNLANLPFANVNLDLDIDTSIDQTLLVQVNALNNVKVIGADLDFDLGILAKQQAAPTIKVA
jgi:hypothetical protein